MSKFYQYRQNNSGGSFIENEYTGIGIEVWICADSTDHADKLAQKIGIYFNGIIMGRDCECCGDRWSTADTIQCYEFLEFDCDYIHIGNNFMTIKKGEDNKPAQLMVLKTLFFEPSE